VSFGDFIGHKSKGFISREDAIKAAEANWLERHIAKRAADRGLWPVRKQGQTDIRTRQRQNFSDLVNILTEVTHNGH
jgi:hypothetical protein